MSEFMKLPDLSEKAQQCLSSHGAGGYLDYMTEAKWLHLKHEGFCPIWLTMFTYRRTWDALSHYVGGGVLTLRDVCVMQCPYLQADYTAFIPTILFTQHPEKMLSAGDFSSSEKELRGEYICDPHWRRFINFEHMKTCFNSVDRAQMGSGYAYSRMMQDGSSELATVFAQLDTGETVVGVTWEWLSS